MILEVDQNEPSKLRFASGYENQVFQIKRFLTFKNRQAVYELQKFKNNPWWARKLDNEAYQERLDELKAKQDVCLFLEDSKGYYTYSGLAEDLKARFQASIQNNISYPFPKLIPWHKKPAELRYYQRSAVDALLKVRHGAVSLSTGLGKSLCILYLAKELGLKTIIMSPTDSIAKQLLADFEMYFGKKYVGFYGDGKKKFDKLFTIGIDDSLTKIQPDSEAWEELSKADVFIADECFESETGVFTDSGNKSISSIVNKVLKGEKVNVLSYDELSKTYVYKSVLNGFKKPMVPLIKVQFSGINLVTTENHKILTKKNGWVKAKDLKPKDVVISYSVEDNNSNSVCQELNSDQEQIVYGLYLGDGSVEMKKNKYRLSVIHGEEQKEYLYFIANMFQVKNIRRIEKNGYSQKPAFNFSTKLLLNEYDLDFKRPKRLCTNILEKIDWRAIAIWWMDDGSINIYKVKNGYRSIGTFNTQSFSDEECLLIINKLTSLNVECYLSHEKKKDGRIFPIIKVSADGMEVLMANIAQYIHSDFRYKVPPDIEIGKYQWDNKYTGRFLNSVLNIENYTHKMRTKSHENLLYDIEVADTHNFIVSKNRRGKSGTVVHNCHLTPAKTVSNVCLGLAAKASYRFFLTATPLRNDGADVFLKGIIGPIVYEMDLRRGVDEGFLAKPIFKMIEVESDAFDGTTDVLKAIRTHVLHNNNIYDIVGKMANKAVEMGEQVLILIDQVDQIPYLESRLIHSRDYAFSGPVPKGLAAGFKKTDPNELVHKFNEGKLSILTGTSCIGMGTNIKPVKTMFLIMGGKSEVKITQAIGRGTRLVEGKTNFNLFDFDVTNIDDIHRHSLMREDLYNKLYGPVTRIKL